MPGVILDRHLFNHRLILLIDSVLDYGPTPFHLFHFRFNIDDFLKVVEDS